MQTWLIVIPDYIGSDHHVIGTFDSSDDAEQWGRTNVGTNRAWFAAPVKGTDDWIATTTQ